MGLVDLIFHLFAIEATIFPALRFVDFAFPNIMNAQITRSSVENFRHLWLHVACFCSVSKLPTSAICFCTFYEMSPRDIGN